MQGYFRGLIFDGFVPVFSGLLGFLPTVVILLTIVSFFKSTGWILGFGCTTLAVSAAKKPNSKTLRFLSFIPCSAKLPVLMFLCGVVLGWSVFGVVFLYLLSVFLGLVFGGLWVLERPAFEHLTFVEFISSLARNVLSFLNRISVGLFAAVTALYTLEYFGLLLPVMQVFAPLFAPIGLADARIVATLIFGLVAKEMIVGAIMTFGVAALGLTHASAVSLLIFAALYTPCVPALSAIKKKIGWRGMFKVASFNFAVAYGLAFAVYTFLTLI